jgi:hypothetical protein
MTTKCTGLMGRIFGHKWRDIYHSMKFHSPHAELKHRECQRCGAVTGEKK